MQSIGGVQKSSRAETIYQLPGHLLRTRRDNSPSTSMSEADSVLSFCFSYCSALLGIIARQCSKDFDKLPHHPL
jgi:hypothetical protein